VILSAWRATVRRRVEVEFVVNSRVTFLIAAGTLLLAACHGANASNTIPAAPSGADIAPVGQARVSLALPVIVPQQPRPVPGIADSRLSSATHSVAGTFASREIPPVALSASTPGCVAQSDGLHCMVALNVPVGSAQLNLSTYASANGTGKPLARASEHLTVTTGSRTYVRAV
ncbi:MAG TPA: hypothetical protein VGF86_01180, partial [Candidatus Tumulicola sp.]